MQRSQTLYERGQFHESEGRLLKAIAYYKEILKNNPNDEAAHLACANAYVKRGDHYLQKNDFEKAIGNYNEALSHNTNRSDAYYRRGIAYYHRGVSYFTTGLENGNPIFIEKALADFNRVIEHKNEVGQTTDDLSAYPDDADIYHNRGVSYFNLGELDKAFADLSQAITLIEHREVANETDEIIIESYDLVHSLAYYTGILKDDPNNVTAYMERGLTYFNSGDLDRAIEDYTQAIELSPDGNTYLSRGIAYQEKKDLNAAISDYLEASRLLNPIDRDALFHLGSAYFELKKFDLVLCYLGKALDDGLTSPKKELAYEYLEKTLMLLDENNSYGIPQTTITDAILKLPEEKQTPLLELCLDRNGNHPLSQKMWRSVGARVPSENSDVMKRIRHQLKTISDHHSSSSCLDGTETQSLTTSTSIVLNELRSSSDTAKTSLTLGSTTEDKNENTSDVTAKEEKTVAEVSENNEETKCTDQTETSCHKSFGL